MTPLELTQWESNSLSSVVPAVTIDGSKLFANYLGHIFALDLKSGKLLWRTARSIISNDCDAAERPHDRYQPIRDHGRG